MSRKSQDSYKQWSLRIGSFFILNFIWKNLHSVLYMNYQGGVITEGILLHATIVDAAILTIIFMAFYFLPKRAKREWMIPAAGIIVATAIEQWALMTNRWTYAAAMPVIPILGIGLTPALQLPAIGYLVYKLLPDSDSV